MRLFIVILIIILVFGLVQIYFIYGGENKLRDKFETLSAKGSALTEENNRIKSDIEYFSNKENLEKELRSKFNYKSPDEKMIIVFP